MATKYKLVSMWDQETSVERGKVFIVLACRKVCSAFSWLIIAVGGSSSLWVVTPWAGGPGFYRV